MMPVFATSLNQKKIINDSLVGDKMSNTDLEEILRHEINNLEAKNAETLKLLEDAYSHIRALDKLIMNFLRKSGVKF
jgi:hypothetical protein